MASIRDKPETFWPGVVVVGLVLGGGLFVWDRWPADRWPATPWPTTEFWVFHHQRPAGQQRGLLVLQLLGPFANRNNAEALLVKLAPDRAGLAIVTRTAGKVTRATYATGRDVPPWPPFGPPDDESAPASPPPPPPPPP